MEIVGVSFWLVCIATLIHGNSDTPDLCVMTPLMTPYFTPLLDTPRKAKGCSSLSTNPNAPFFARLDSTNQTKPSQDVHVISLTTVGSKSGEPQTVRLLVILSGTGNESGDGVLDRLVLVLSSDRPVKWLLKTSTEDDDDNEDDNEDDVYMTTIPWVLISEGSQAEANFNMNVTHHQWGNKKALHRDVKKKFRGIASYTEVKGANHLELKVGAASKSFVQCDMSAQDDSAVVTASLMVQLKTEGCFHEHYIGDNSVDVYVVELDGGGGGLTKGRNKRVGPKSLVPVTVHLLGEGTRPVPRNVTVVLKSHQPIKWQFGVRRIHGNIVVVSDREDQVENASAGGGGYETLEVRPKTLPDNMVDLLLKITSEFGPPILYAKTAYASTLQLVVGNKNKSGVRSGPESQVFADASGEPRRGDDPRTPNHPSVSSFPETVLVTSFTHESADPVGQLKAAMTVDCGARLINVTFPQTLLKALRSPHLSLSDPLCVATYNRTHGSLTSQTTSCGYTGDSYSSFMLFSNFVKIKFSGPAESDDEDFEASGDMAEDLQIPVMCKYLPHNRGDVDGPGERVNPDDPEGRSNLGNSQPSLYQLEVYRDEAFTSKLDFNRRESSEVQLEDTLYVKAYLDGRVPVQMVTEECWLANSSDKGQQRYAPLIRKTCPASVTTKLLSPTDGIQHGRFSFQVGKELGALSQVFLHCKLGLCSLDKERSKGNLKMCVNPAQYCTGSPLRFYLNQTVATAQQDLVRGPLLLVSKVSRQPPPKTTPSRPTADNGVASETSDSRGASTIVHVGVSVEVTVGIALASFLVGVALTAVLWCIHIKTDPFRQRNKQLGGSTAGGGAVANLSPHSGCSSANSQAAITT